MRLADRFDTPPNLHDLPADPVLCMILASRSHRSGLLAERLCQLGLHPGQARSTALFQLATELPAAFLARMLGIHIAVAVAWQRASSGDWARYAADVSRRAPRHEDR